MIENLPEYISILFILTTFITIGFLLYAIKQSVSDTIPAKILIFLLSFWIFFQAILALSGFYQDTQSFPPHLVAFGVFPTILLIVIYFIFFRKKFIEPLPLKILTLLSVVRIFVEIVLLWLFQNHFVPQSMTFEGRNFDILSGITAPIIYLLAFRGGKINRPLLIIWNIFALILLFNVVITAILAFPSVNPQLAPEFQNRAVTYFPYVWLPTVIVPIVFFSHAASLWKLLKSQK
jgi:hypothetical protein